MDRLTSMSVFVKAVDLGSFAAAAVLLGISGPMVGKHIRVLEERLGVRLITRTTRRQSLTDFGRTYYERCRQILAEIDAADALAADQLSEPRGRLRITMPGLLGRRCVSPILLALARKYPSLELELSFSDRITDLTEGEYDLAIRTGSLEDKAGIIARRIARHRMIVCASPAYLDVSGTPLKLEDLNRHQAILYRRAGWNHSWLFPGNGERVVEVALNSRLRLDDLDAIADAATSGMGLAWLPSWLIRERVQAGTLVPLLPDEPTHVFDNHVLWLRTPHLARKVRLAIDELAAELPKFMT
jgi:DNA-binding transcriptional LysR family regulator